MDDRLEKPPGGRRDFVDVMWQIAEKRSCDEVFVRYDCGHCVKADVWVPVLPRTREYTNQEADRRRFMQHSIFALTKNPGSPKVQITVPEGRCRHCSRGQRQVLICGPLQMDLADERPADKRSESGANRPRNSGPRDGRRDERKETAIVPANHAKMELPLSSQVFLAAMGQVCRLPNNITPPPLLQNSSVLQSGALKPAEGPPLSKESLHQWSRKEIEDELKAEVVKYVGGATFLLMFIIIECLYLCIIHFGPSSKIGVGGGGNSSRSLSGELRNLSSVSSVERFIANSTWVLSALTVTVHKAFGPGQGVDSTPPSTLWSSFVHPLWILVSIVLAPFLWVLDLVVALPRFLLVHVVFALLYTLVWRPCGWIFGIVAELVNGSVGFLFRCLFARPISVLSQIPMTNPMVAAILLSILVAAISLPSSPSFTMPSFNPELPSFEFLRKVQQVLLRTETLGPFTQWSQTLLASARKDAKARAGVRGVPNLKNQKDKFLAPGGKPENSKAGGRHGQESRAAGGAPCVVCLERPSCYLLEPCGHKVVCSECAIQLVDAAARNRSNEAMGAPLPSGKSSGGSCPSCGLAITRAMRVFK